MKIMKSWKLSLLVALSTLTLLLPWKARALTIDEVIQMVQAGVPDSVIISTIEASDTVFSMTARDIIKLNNAGVSESVIDAMNKTKMKRGRPSPAPALPPTLPQMEVEPETEPVREPAAPRKRYEEPASEEAPKRVKERVSVPEETAAPPAPERRRKEEISVSVTPMKIRNYIKHYQKKKYMTASHGLFTILQRGEYPDQKSKIEYYIGKCLYFLKLYDAASSYFLNIVRDGPDNPYFKWALAYLYYAGKKCGDNSMLAPYIENVPVSEFPAKVKSELIYLIGVKKFSEENYAYAVKYFQAVSPKSTFYLNAKYLESVIFHRQGRLRPAVQLFQDIIKEEELYGDPEDIKNIKDLALLNIARTFYNLQKFDRAKYYYEHIPRDSLYWPQSLVESAWADFMLSDYNSTLGKILSIESPFFRYYYLPEAQILKSITFFSLCEYEEVNKLIRRFQEGNYPILNGLKKFLKHFAKEKDMAGAFRASLGDSGGKFNIPESIKNTILINKDLQAIYSHVKEINAELSLLEGTKTAWKTSPIGQNLKQSLLKNRHLLEERGGRIALREITSMAKTLTSFMGQSDIILFEVVAALKDEYEEKFRNPEAIETYEELEHSYATEKTYIYWPFNNEFWEDELGYYHFTERGSCKK